MKRETIQIYLCSLWCIIWSPIAVHVALWMDIAYTTGIFFIGYTAMAPLLILVTVKMWKMSKEDK